MFGIVTIGDKRYQERFFQIPWIAVIGAGIIRQDLIATDRDCDGFLLKWLTRQVTVGGPNFRCRLGISDGPTWYSGRPVNAPAGASDRVLDSLMFGDGQFPFALVPWVFVAPGVSILLELEDIAAGFTAEFALQGAKLFEVR